MGSDVPSEPRPPRQTRRRRRGKARAIDPYQPDQGGASAIPWAPVLVLVSLIPQNQPVRVPIPGVGRMVRSGAGWRTDTENLAAGQRVG
jgi:hypothetical protein